jgi:hypothetical protein
MIPLRILGLVGLEERAGGTGSGSIVEGWDKVQACFSFWEANQFCCGG